MAKILFKDLLEEAKNKYQTVEGGGASISREELDMNVKVLLKLMSTDGSSLNVPKIAMKEALGTADASILFPKVIDQVLVKPTEPQMFASTRLAKVITIAGGARSVTFPTIGAIRAAEIGETQDYPQAHPAFTEFTTEVKVSKFGVMIPVSEMVLEDSMWDVLALFVEAGRFAMDRLKEERCFNEFSERSTVVFDNCLADSNAWTTGTDAAASGNGTLAWADLVDALGVLISNEYTPTDIAVHPLLWTVFAKDPILNYQVLNSGNGSNALQNVGPESMNQTLQVPFTLNISPFISYTASKALNAAVPISAAGPVTDIHIVDKNNSLVLLVKEGLSSEEFTDPYRDIRFVKIKERYGTGVLNAGKGSVVLKNVRIAANQGPLYTIRSL